MFIFKVFLFQVIKYVNPIQASRRRKIAEENARDAVSQQAMNNMPNAGAGHVGKKAVSPSIPRQQPPHRTLKPGTLVYFVIYEITYEILSGIQSASKRSAASESANWESDEASGCCRDISRSGEQGCKGKDKRFCHFKIYFTIFNLDFAEQDY